MLSSEAKIGGSRQAEGVMHMPVWEYLFVTSSLSTTEPSNGITEDIATQYQCFVALGKLGWECVAVEADYTIFKRPVGSPPVDAPARLLPKVEYLRTSLTILREDAASIPG
jgi:hypothetical protein